MIDERSELVARPRQVPGPNPRHVNRDEQLDHAVKVVLGSGTNHVVAFGGLPGIGKTTTARELAHRVGDHYPDGQLFAELDGGANWAGSESQILKEFLLALGDRPEDIPDRLEARRSRYREKTTGSRLLVFLDRAVTASQIRTLTPGAGRSLIIVTEARRATDLSEGGVTVYELDRLSDEAALELLTRIVGAARIAAEPTAADDIVALCDNMPFAIAIVGSMIGRSATFPMAAMATTLRQDSRRYTKLSLVEVFDTALTSLSSAARRCYRLLGLDVHSGIVGLPAVAAALEMPEDKAYEAMVELVEVFLVGERADGRYEACEAVRLHAKHVTDGPQRERDAEAKRMLAHYHRMVVAAIAGMAPARPWAGLLFPAMVVSAAFDRVADGHEWLRIEHRNILAAAGHAFRSGDYELVRQWAVLLWPFYEKDKDLDGLFTLLQLGIKASAEPGSTAVASLLHTQQGYRCYWLRDLDAAEESLRAAVQPAREAKPKAVARQLEASALEGLGLVLLARGRIIEALDVLRHNHKLAVKIKDPRRIALAMLHLAKAEPAELALPRLEQARSLFVRLPSEESENLAKVDMVRGRKLLEQRDFREAVEALKAPLSVMRERRRWFDVGEILVALGDAASGLNDPVQAEERYRDALATFNGLGFAELVTQMHGRITALHGMPE
ncbi:MAG: hypothetical protein HOQ24_08845 [Mycobacteriaceae bacterium]|nr:hypothetical protein [Mycobacteriaceae bacterium]